MIAMAVIGLSAPKTNEPVTPTQVVITVLPGPGGTGQQNLAVNDFTVQHGNTPVQIVGLQPLTGDLADVQLFILLDDSSRSASLGNQIGELKTFIKSLPPTTQLAIGYMRNGTFSLAQKFTVDHAAAASSVRLPMAIPGGNGSPYFALSDLVKRWPSKESTHRRVVLMLTDGVDPYYGSAIPDDPYVDEAMHDSLKAGVMVYSVYLRGAGLYGWNSWVTTMAQSRLGEVSQETGGFAYFQGTTDPVSISPFLNDFEDRLNHQYRLTIEALNPKGVQAVKVRTELPGLKIDAPNHVFVR